MPLWDVHSRAVRCRDPSNGKTNNYETHQCPEPNINASGASCHLPPALPTENEDGHDFVASPAKQNNKRPEQGNTQNSSQVVKLNTAKPTLNPGTIINFEE
jgi:hypothetical protein